MVATTEILQFAGAGGANVLSQADYAALAAILSDGYTSGILDSNLLNKTLRQSNFMAVGVAKWLVAQGISVPDDGDVTTLVANITTALEALIAAHSGNYALDTGIANAYVIALSPPVTGYTNGMRVSFRAAHANTAASTLDAGGGAIALVNDIGGALVSGDIPATAVVTAVYDQPSSKFLIVTLVTSQALTQAQADTRYVQPADLIAQTYDGYTTNGISTAYTITPTPVLGAYAARVKYQLTFHATCGNAPTLAISGLATPPNLVKENSDGSYSNLAAGDVPINHVSDVVLLSPTQALVERLPPTTVGAGVPVRQTVLSGPVDSGGLPTFLPASGAGLTITSQNVSGSAPFIVTAADGFVSTGAVDRVGESTANLTWGSLGANNTNYLYVDVASNGTLTPGSTILPPTYQFGGVRSNTNGQAVFNIQDMFMSVGDGAGNHPQTYRVFVGEAVTNGANVTSTAAYAYQGRYDSGFTATIPSAATSVVKSSNIGVKPWMAAVIYECTSADNGYSSGDQVLLSGYVNFAVNNLNVSATPNSVTLSINNNPYMTPKGGGTQTALTAANWQYKMIANRGW